MHSLRTRITLMTVLMITIAVSIVTVVCVLFVRTNEHRKSDQLLLLMCETGEKNLDFYFNSVQNSLRKVSSFVEADIDGIDDEHLSSHMERVRKYFEEMVFRTNGVLTYYYRIDPAVSSDVKGFWYTNVTGEGFVEHEPTDITEYDTSDTTKLVWFTVPKHKGEAIWLPPYITDNLNVRVISYNVPIYWKGTFVGVAGIEIDYSAMAEQVESIRLFNNGYAFLSDDQGNIFFHPEIDVSSLSEDAVIEAPEGLASDSTFYRYVWNGVEKQGVWLPLSNGMRLNVTVPLSETEGDWQNLIGQIIGISVIVLLTLSIVTLYYTGKITKPLENLTEAAEQVDRGNYDFVLEYSGDDEVGRLTNTFMRLVDHTREHIRSLNKRIFVDALTSVKNKGAFAAALEQLQKEIKESNEPVKFAVGVFDCDDLKLVNDRYGHDKGDIYLKNSCRLICKIFQHSPVYRIGGDEFAVILRKEDYRKREELIREFDSAAKQTWSLANRWEQVRTAKGIADYNPELDGAAGDTVRRADSAMYADKRAQKSR